MHQKWRHMISPFFKGALVTLLGDFSLMFDGVQAWSLRLLSLSLGSTPPTRMKSQAGLWTSFSRESLYIYKPLFATVYWVGGGRPVLSPTGSVGLFWQYWKLCFFQVPGIAWRTLLTIFLDQIRFLGPLSCGLWVGFWVGLMLFEIRWSPPISNVPLKKQWYVI